jgi:Raf kinase inhibitor-like YbhB/YbcL family protein
MLLRLIPLAVASTWLAAAASAASFELRSSDVSEGATMSKAHEYAGYGCTGDNLAPALSWTGAPAGTRSFALTVYDPDAPTGKGWWHWVVFDLPPTTTSLARGVRSAGLPAGAHQALNDFGTRDFGGACPPPGDKPHRYVFTIYALKVDKLDVPPDAIAAVAGSAIDANQIAKASITARYGR